MFSKNMLRSMTATLIVLAFLTPAVAQGAGGRIPLRRDSKPVASRVQERGGVLQSLWNGLSRIFEKEGASIDPDGQHGTGTGSSGSGTGGTGTTGGASIDPSGAIGG